ncbi:hypothetical protein AMECASPLE_023561 [Ameca splendens]|uniref:Uncharacterized protein n=1 Tax=Ameca splendens TaxID=208324 RepID=A0ABV0ZZM5_9TELE
MAKGGEVKTPVVQIDYNTLTPEDVIQGALGFTESNLWLTWMAQTAHPESLYPWWFKQQQFIGVTHSCS